MQSKRPLSLAFAGFALFLFALPSFFASPGYCADDAVARRQKAESLCNKGMQARSLQRDDEAEKCFVEAIKLYPQGDFLYTSRADFYKEKGKFDLALADVRKAVSLSGGSLENHKKLADMLDMLGRLDEALVEYDYVLARQKTDFRTLLRKAQALKRMKRYAQSAYAFGLASQAGANEENIVEAMSGEAEMYFAAKDDTKSLASFARLIKKYPMVSRGYWGRAKLYDRLKKADLAKADRKKAEELDLSLGTL